MAITFGEKSLGLVTPLLAALVCVACASGIGEQRTAASGNAGTSGALDGGTTGTSSDGGLFATWPGGKYLSPSDVHQLVLNGNPDMLLVNVVDEEYYTLGHIANSLKIPWDILANSLSQVDKSRHVVLYCRRGVRSESAYETLTGNAYPYVWIMEGGLEAWIAAGYPTVAN